MTCMYCQGKMERGSAPFHIDRKGYHLILDAIPAWVCVQCGEAYFDEATVEAIQRVIRAVDKHTENLVLSA
jgi:YgiT-type zinc finger domain-containing protein